MNIKIYVSDSTTISAYISLLEEVGTWLWKKGIKQWEPGTHRSATRRIEDLVMNGYLILAKQESRLAGGCILSCVAPEFWKRDPHAIYLSGLVVARFAAGQGVGTALIEYCARQARADNLQKMRLDCWDGNDFLKAYYQKAGFEMQHRALEKDYWVRLFEMNL